MDNLNVEIPTILKNGGTNNTRNDTPKETLHPLITSLDYPTRLPNSIVYAFYPYPFLIKSHHALTLTQYQYHISYLITCILYLYSVSKSACVQRSGYQIASQY